MSEWISIESAPKDGEDILCFEGCRCIVLYWNDYEDNNTSWCTHVFGKQKGWLDFQDEIHDPTHWMPLPKPPKND